MCNAFNKFGLPATKSLFGVVSLALVFGCAQVDQRAEIAAPELKVGEAWTYSIVMIDRGDPQRKRTEYGVMRQVEKVTDAAVWVRERNTVFAGHEMQVKFDKQWNPVEAPLLNNSAIVRFDPHLPVFNFPLAPGQKWTRNFTVSQVESRDVGEEGQSEGKVIGWEEITVPVGRFKALRIETLTPYYTGQRTRIIFADPNLYGGAQEHFWYVPELKNVVKHVREDYIGRDHVRSTESELIDYKLEDRAFAR